MSPGPQTAAIPNVIGQPAQAAATTLTGAGFNVVVSELHGLRGGEDAEPGAGGTAPLGTTVTIFC